MRLLFSPRGRVGRLSFLGGLVLCYFGAIAIYFVALLVFGVGLAAGSIIFMVLSPVGIFGIVPLAVVCSFMLQIKRLHDLNLSGWWALAMAGWNVVALEMLFHSGPEPIFVSAMNWLSFIGLLVLLFVPGTRGVNRYGL